MLNTIRNRNASGIVFIISLVYDLSHLCLLEIQGIICIVNDVLFYGGLFILMDGV